MAINTKELEQFVRDNIDNVRFIEVFTVDNKKYNFFFSATSDEHKIVVAEYVDGKKVMKKYDTDNRINKLARLLIKEKGINNFYIQAIFD